MTRAAWLPMLVWMASTGMAAAQGLPAVSALATEPQSSVAASTDVKANVLPRPRVRVGKVFSIELTAKVQGDVSGFDPVVDKDDEDFNWARRRLGIKGELFNRVSFEVEREFGDDANPWRDVYVNLKATNLFEVKAGKFKVPFSLDVLTSEAAGDFVFRSIAARTLSPRRDVGVMAHGRTKGRRVAYAVGVFEGDDSTVGAKANFDGDGGDASFGRTVGARVTAQPFDAFHDWPRAIRHLEIAVNGAWSTIPSGLHGFRGRSVYGHEFFAPVYVNGDRIRAGVDAVLMAGPTSLKAEWIGAWDERLEQGLGDVDLPKAFGRGWYVSGTWLVTGEVKDTDVRPKRPFLQGGIGALELAARYERFGLGSTATAGEPAFSNPRAANLLRNRDDVLTFGLSWYLNRWFRLQGNALHESFDDVARAPIVGESKYWSYVARLQFVL